MLSHSYVFVPNDNDNLHCFQATMRMAWQGLFGEKLSAERADELSGFVADQSTWPFAGMLALADRGAIITNVEDFIPETFVRDPAAEILRQSKGNKELTEQILKVADAEAQRPLVQRCIDHDRINFERHAPTLAELRHTVNQPNTAVICNVNYRALVGREGYNGHFVLVEKVSESQVVLQDPGLPPLKDHEVSTEVFAKSWESLENMIVCVLPPKSNE